MISENLGSSDEVKLKIGRLFVRMSVTYGHLWSSQFKNDDMLMIGKLEWAKSIGHYPAERMDMAFEYCKIKYKIVPTLPEFMTCFKVSQYEATIKRKIFTALPTNKETREKKHARQAKIAAPYLKKLKLMLNVNPGVGEKEKKTPAGMEQYLSSCFETMTKEIE